jgi:hypothetical protein
MIALKRYKSFARGLYGFEHLYEMEDIDIKISLIYAILYAELPDSAIRHMLKLIGAISK